MPSISSASQSSLPAKPLVLALTGELLELMSVIIRQRPATVGDLACMTGRASSNVARALKTLKEFGLIRMIRVGSTTCPEPIAGALHLDLLSGTFRTLPLEEDAA